MVLLVPSTWFESWKEGGSVARGQGLLPLGSWSPEGGYEPTLPWKLVWNVILIER